MNVHDFTVKDKKGNDVSLSEYKGKVLVIVNTATKCGLTPQYDALEAMYEKYHDKGFEIYQVSLDVDNGLWARVMKEQKLPWTNVSDISGGASRYVMAYNLSAIPSAFVIGGNGLAGTAIKDAKSLEEAVAKALK